MNVYAKLTEARARLAKKEMQKSGRNTYSNYDYYELSDFIQPIIEINQELGLCSVMTFDNENAYLTIYNTEKLEENIQYSIKLHNISLKACNEMQSEGALHTFARRYLYIDAYEISEKDLMDTTENSEHADTEEERLRKEKEKVINDLKVSCRNAGFTEKQVIDEYNAKDGKDAKTLEDIPVKRLAAYDRMMEISIKKQKQDAKNKK